VAKPTCGDVAEFEESFQGEIVKIHTVQCTKMPRHGGLHEAISGMKLLRWKTRPRRRDPAPG